MDTTWCSLPPYPKPTFVRATVKIKQVSLHAEANIAGEFYHRARTIGMQVALEVGTPCGRLDIAVLNATRDSIVAIVECKRSAATISSWQMWRYRQIGVPVYTLTSFSTAAALADEIFAKLPELEPVSFTKINNAAPLTTGPRRAARHAYREEIDLNIKNSRPW